MLLYPQKVSVARRPSSGKRKVKCHSTMCIKIIEQSQYSKKAVSQNNPTDAARSNSTAQQAPHLGNSALNEYIITVNFL
jgi:hypothetical protein